MACENRSSAPDLGKHIQANARHWSFFQAVEHIQRQYGAGREVGAYLLPKDEKIQFSVDHSLGFPISDIKQLALSGGEAEGAGLPLQMEVTFLGLHGSGSPLPSYYQEVIASYDAEGSLLKGFFDFFHNRLIGLLHRAMRKYRYYVRYQPGADDPFSQWMFCIFGLADKEARRQAPVNWARLLTFAGIFASRNRSPQVISSVVAHAFFLKEVEVEEWVQRKVDIPLEQRSCLGQANMSLGGNTVIGERVPDISGKFNVYLKNLAFNRFQDFLPRRSGHKALRHLIEFMLRDQHAYDIKLGLAPDEAPPLELNEDCQGRLGWSSFLGKGRAGRRDVLITARL